MHSSYGNALRTRLWRSTMTARPAPFAFASRSVVNSLNPSMGDPMDLSQNGVVVVKFTAQWCGPCKTIAPQFALLSDQYPTVSFYDVDVDDNAAAAKNFTVRAVPTFVVLHKGKIEARVEGSAIVTVKEAIDKIVAPAEETLAKQQAKPDEQN